MSEMHPILDTSSAWSSATASPLADFRKLRGERGDTILVTMQRALVRDAKRIEFLELALREIQKETGAFRSCAPFDSNYKYVELEKYGNALLHECPSFLEWLKENPE